MSISSRLISDAAPLVSIGLPTFNRVQSLRRAIKSVLDQDYPNIELIVSDNCSTDGTGSLCEEYRAVDSRFRYIRQEQNRGAYANFVSVFEAAQGKYFMWLGDDDWLGESYVSRCADVLSANPDVALACGVAKYFDRELLVFEGVNMNLTAESPLDRVVSFYRQVSDNGTFYGLMRRNEMTGMPAGSLMANDWLFIAGVAMRGKIITLTDVVVNRDRDGVSSNLEALALKSGLTSRRARRPYQAITKNVLKEILLESPAFVKLSLLARVALAWRVMRIMNKRFLINEHPMWIWTNKVRFRLKLRTRLKRTFHID